jgi:hypothetical protein
MNRLESTSPGTKAQFFLGYLERGAPLFEAQDAAELRPCASCGEPTTGRFCAFCRAQAQILGRRLEDRLEAEEDPQRFAAQLSDEVLPVEIYGAAATSEP